MSVYTSTSALNYKAGYAHFQLSQKRSSIKENSKKIDALFSPDALDIHNRSGKAIINSPPLKITGKTILHSNVVRHYMTTQEKMIWRYLLRPGRSFFMWLLLSLLGGLAMVM